VQAISLQASASVVGANWVSEDDEGLLWVASNTGFIKRSPLGEYPRKGRATGGVATMQLAPKTSLIGAAVLEPTEDVLLIAESGHTARVTGDVLPVVARDRKGVGGMKLEGSDHVARMVVLPGT